MAVVIRAEGLTKVYHIGKQRSSSLRETVTDKVGKLFTKGSDDPTTFYALNNISFEVRNGEVLGIIGKNGAGKSTLLKILSRITEPSRGSASIEGRVASLLEVGTGFHPELTGRENIFLNGAILGMKRNEIRNRFDEIVSFSGIEQFIDTPVKRYSSGMYVRLAFAVAAHLEPDILIIDEVLAVGDLEFQKKCLGKMKDVNELEGRTVLFVSHNMPAVKSLCTKAMLLDHGTVITEGSVDQVIQSYTAPYQNYTQEISLEEVPRERGKQEVIFRKIVFNNASYYPNSVLSIDLQLRINSPSVFKTVDIGVHIVDLYDHQVFHLSNLFLGKEDVPISERMKYRFQIPELRLKPGYYKMWLWLSTKGIEQDWIGEGIMFEVLSGNVYDFSKSGIISGVVQPQFEFTTINE